MTMSIATTGGFLKTAVAAATVTLTLGAATVASVAPAEAHPFHHGHVRPHFGGFHHGFGHRFGGFRPGFHRFGFHPAFHRYGFGYGRFHRGFGFRPAFAVGVPVYGYAWHRPVHHAWGPYYGWHHRCI